MIFEYLPPLLNENSVRPVVSLNDEYLERLTPRLATPDPTPITAPTPKAKPCFSLNDFKRAQRLSCCFSRSVGAALNCPRTAKKNTTMLTTSPTHIPAAKHTFCRILFSYGRRFQKRIIQ